MNRRRDESDDSADSEYDGHVTTDSEDVGGRPVEKNEGRSEPEKRPEPKKAQAQNRFLAFTYKFDLNFDLILIYKIQKLKPKTGLATVKNLNFRYRYDEKYENASALLQGKVGELRLGPVGKLRLGPPGQVASVKWKAEEMEGKCSFLFRDGTSGTVTDSENESENEDAEVGKAVTEEEEEEESENYVEEAGKKKQKLPRMFVYNRSRN